MLVAATNVRAATQTPDRCRTAPVPVLCAIHYHHHRVNVLRGRMGLARIPYHWIADRRSTSDARRSRILTYWTRVHARTRARYVRWRRALAATPWTASWHAAAMCIHHYEGPWNAYNAAGPYYGGMQMDAGFMADYGPEFVRAYGDARNWPARDQLLAAWRAYTGWYNPAQGRHIAGRGWGPWPNTAAMCGL